MRLCPGRGGAVWLTAALLFVSLRPCAAWLLDGGPTQHLGVQLKLNSSLEWAAEPFTIPNDGYATSLGAAVARGMGPADAGFDIYLTATPYGLPGSAIAKLSQPLIPLNTQYVYYYGNLDSPVFLAANTVYFVVLMPTSSSFIGSLSLSNTAGLYYGLGTGNDGETWYQLARPVCVRVDGWYVPEPCSLAMVFSGVGVGLALRRRRVER